LKSPEEIIDKISQLQSTGNKIYNPGLFPSQRVHPFLGYCREDNNIFFSALVAFTIKQLEWAFTDSLRNRARKIREAVISNYEKYQHDSDPATYNFWQNRQRGHFPNGCVLNKIPKMALPADSDDTSLIYLTSPHQNQLETLKNKLESQYPIDSPLSPLTPQAYQNLRAYPSFFGKRILREMDACVISNVLFMVCHYQLPWTPVDTDSVQFLNRVLERNDHIKSPFLVSPHYGNSTIILYHIARLVGGFNHKELLALRALLIRCLTLELKKKLSFMETLLVKTSLLRLQIDTTPLHIHDVYENHFRDFYFFQAGMLTGLQHSRLKRLANNSFFHLKYRCEAYYWTLLLENIILSQNS